MSDTKPPEKRPVAIVSGGRSTLPLLKPLSEHFNIAILYPQVAENAAKQGLPVANLTLLADDEVKARSTGEALRLCSGLWEALESGQLGQTFEQGGFPADNLSNWLPSLVFQSCSRQIVRLKVWERMADHFDVRVCITHEDVCEDTKGMCQFWRGRGVPTLHVPHAVYHGLWRAEPGQDVHDELTCEWIAASGQYQRDWYVQLGMDAERIVVTGAPSWDKWAKPPDKAWARNALKVDVGKPVVVYASSWAQATSACGGHGLVEAGYAAFLDVAREADWMPVVKLHPSAGQHSHQMHAKRANEAGARCMLTPHYLDIVLQAADLVVALGPSNILTEAALLGTPSVSLFGYGDDEAVVTCELEDLGVAIELGLSRDWQAEFSGLRDEFVEKYAYRNDGQATERVVALVEELGGIHGRSGGV